MGKAKKIKVSKNETKIQRKVPLADQIEQAGAVKMKNRVKNRKRVDGDEELVDPKLTNKILKQARQQQQEIEEEVSEAPAPRFKQPTTKLGNGLSGDEASSDDGKFPERDYFYDNIIELDEEDERAMEMFMDKDGRPLKTVADVILETLKEKKTELATELSDDEFDSDIEELDP